MPLSFFLSRLAQGKFSIALMYYLLCREVLRLRDAVPRDRAWDVMVDMFIYRDPEEAEKQEQAAKAAALKPAGEVADSEWTEQGTGADWAGDATAEEWAARGKTTWSEEQNEAAGEGTW